MTTEDESLRIDETMVEDAAHSTLNLSLLDESLINKLIDSDMNDIDIYDFGLESNILDLDTVHTTKARISQTQENDSASSDISYNISKENASNGPDFLETYASKNNNERVSECNTITKLFNNRHKSIVKQRSWDRKNCCCYCRELVTNFTRHLKRKHCNEIEVMKLMSITSNNLKEKKKKTMEITNILRNRGNFAYNSEAASNEDGKILPARRTLRYKTALPSSPSAFVVCRKCLGTFRRATFFKHFKNCDQDSKVDDDDSLKRKRVISTKALPIIPNVQGATEQLKQLIIPHLRNDNIFLIVKHDDLILAYGSRLLKKKKERRSRKAIASRMRDLATLLKIIRTKNTEIKTLRDVLKTKYFENFIESVKEMCGFDNQSGFVNITSVPARIRPAIVACLEILYTQSILDPNILESKKEDIKKTVNEFKLLIEANWQWEISSNADKSRKKKLMTKDQILPLDEDIKTVMAKIHELESQYSKDLQKEATILNYENMCEVTIAHIILLDRKRSGDVAEAELSYYLNRKKDEIPLQVLQMLTKEQRNSMDQLDIFQIPVKRTRAVPVLLTKAMRQNIDLLITCRKKLKIKDSNLYLFARPLTDEPFDGGKCLNRIKSMCSLKNPSMLTATGLRHHAATMSQVHATHDDNYTEHLASFLGHDVSVHMKNYRLPLQVLQKGIVGSKLLEIEHFRNENEINNNSKIIEVDKKITNRRKSIDISNEKNMKLFEEQNASNCVKKYVQNQNEHKNTEENNDQSGKIYHMKENIKPTEERRTTRNQERNFIESSSDISISPSSPQKEVTRRKKKVNLRWTEEEMAIVKKHFKNNIKEKRNPGKAACLDVLKKEPKLQRRSWEQLNSYVNNIYKKKL